MQVLQKEYVYQGIVNPVMDIFFHAQITSGQAITAESTEVSAWIWLNLLEAGRSMSPSLLRFARDRSPGASAGRPSFP